MVMILIVSRNYFLVISLEFLNITLNRLKIICDDCSN